jgi:hypothetical protein
MDDYRLPKIILNAECVGGKRIPGGQECTYKSSVKEDFKKFNISLDYTRWSEAVLNRKEWRKAVKTDGVRFFMKQWRNDRISASNNRKVHRARLNINVILLDKEYNNKHFIRTSNIIMMERAIHSGAVTVCRGSDERSRKTKGSIIVSGIVSKRVSFVRRLLVCREYDVYFYEGVLVSCGGVVCLFVLLLFVV